MQSNRTPIYLPVALGIAILAVSTASIFIRLAQQDAPSITIAALRLTFATLVLAPITLVRNRAELVSLKKKQLLLALLSGVFLAAHFATWITSLEFTSVTSSVVLVSTGPLWVALLSPVVLHERLGPGAAVGLGLALFGGLIIAAAGSCSWQDGLHCSGLGTTPEGTNLLGNLLALLGAWAVTGYLLIGRRLRTSMSLAPYIFLAYGSAAVVLLIAAVLTDSLVLDLPAQTYLWIILLALVPQLIGHSTYNWALRYLAAAAVAVTTLGEPVGSAVLAFFILHERPGTLVLVGAVLILAGIYVAVRGPGQKEAGSA
jgi:drug/metabolite transporter (DMT)-like permease